MNVNKNVFPILYNFLLDPKHSTIANLIIQNQQMNEQTRIKLRETRRQMMADLETSMLKGKSPEDSIFYYHSSEDRIVLSHALF